VLDAGDGRHWIGSRGCRIARDRNISTLDVKLNVGHLLVGGPFPPQHTVIAAWQLLGKDHAPGDGSRKVKPVGGAAPGKRRDPKEILRCLDVVIVAEIQVAIPRVASLAGPSHVEGHTGLKWCLRAV